jgi:hypothetical protein
MHGSDVFRRRCASGLNVPSDGTVIPTTGDLIGPYIDGLCTAAVMIVQAEFGIEYDSSGGN